MEWGGGGEEWGGVERSLLVGWGGVKWGGMGGGGGHFVTKVVGGGGGRSHCYKSCGGAWGGGPLCYQSFFWGEGVHLVTKIVAGVGVTLLQNLWGGWGINDLCSTSLVLSLELPKGKLLYACP